MRSGAGDAGYVDRPFDRERTSVILGASGGVGDLGVHYGVRAGLPRCIERRAGGRCSTGCRSGPRIPFAGILLERRRRPGRQPLRPRRRELHRRRGLRLVAGGVYLAPRELERARSDMVIVGGVDTVQSPFGYLCFSKTQALSPRGRCRTFDAEADGIVISEGLAMLVLKRLATPSATATGSTRSSRAWPARATAAARA